MDYGTLLLDQHNTHRYDEKEFYAVYKGDELPHEVTTIKQAAEELKARGNGARLVDYADGGDTLQIGDIENTPLDAICKRILSWIEGTDPNVYLLTIETADPNVQYFVHGSRDHGRTLHSTQITGAHMPDIRDQADKFVERVLAHAYTDWNSVPAHLRETDEQRMAIANDPLYRDYENVTHQVDMHCPWLGDTDDDGSQRMIKYVYTAYENDFEGYQRYRAVLQAI